jgi:signal transduction histidine kinase
VTVADTGQGIARELRGRIFEPFVTSKGMTGTGLGLWVSREIVQKHGGSIRVRSRAHGTLRGTVFAVFLAQTPSLTRSEN